MKGILLDTDTISYFFRGIPQIREKVEQHLNSEQGLNISVISYYEVCNGLYYRDAKKQLKQFKEFASYCTIIPLNQEIADLAAKIFADLRKKGKNVGHTDILIAGTAIFYELQLITNNTKHFKDIEELNMANWMVD